MADCLSRGRIISGFARGVPREYNVYNVPMAESRARFEEAVEVILKAWTEPKFSHQGKFWKFEDIAIWPRPYQQPRPPVWIPFTGSKETIEWAGKHNFSAVLPDFKRGLTEDIVGHFAKSACAKRPPHHARASVLLHRRVGRERQGGGAEGVRAALFLFRPNALASRLDQGKGSGGEGSGYINPASFDYVRPENRASAGLDREKMKTMTIADVEKRIDDNMLAWGSAKHVAERLIDAAERITAPIRCC